MLIPPFLALLQEHAEGSPAFVHRLLAVLTLFFQETEAQRSRRLCLRSRGVSVCLEAECRNTTVQVAQMTSADAPSSARWTPRSGCWWLGVWLDKGSQVSSPLALANVESVANRESEHNEPPTAPSTRRRSAAYNNAT